VGGKIGITTSQTNCHLHILLLAMLSLRTPFVAFFRRAQTVFWVMMRNDKMRDKPKRHHNGFLAMMKDSLSSAIASKTRRTKQDTACRFFKKIGQT
jgi:hypothetical protein